MPTLLWRVLSSMGYPKGREPRYYWDKVPLGDETLLGAAGCTSPEVSRLSTVPAGQLSQY